MDTEVRETNVQQGLKQLFVELQKIKDLNNLANEYKTISAELILSLDDHLKDCKSFSDAFNSSLLQTNRSEKETNQAIRSMNVAIRNLEVANGTVKSKVEALAVGLNHLEEHVSAIEKSTSKINQKVSIQLESLGNDLFGLIAQSKKELIIGINSNEQSVAKHANCIFLKIIRKINRTIVFQKVIVVLLIIILVLLVVALSR